MQSGHHQKPNRVKALTKYHAWSLMICMYDFISINYLLPLLNHYNSSNSLSLNFRYKNRSYINFLDDISLSLTNSI